MLLTGIMWYSLFALLGLNSSRSTDLVYWSQEYSRLSDTEAETVLTEHLTILAQRLAAKKPCIVRKSKTLIRVIKDGCHHRKDDEVDGNDGDDNEDPSTVAESPQFRSKDGLVARKHFEASLGARSKAESAAALAKAMRAIGGGGGGSKEHNSLAVGNRAHHDPEPSWWDGPPLLDPWRNVGGPRMRVGWRYEKEDNENTIFVSIVSFRDRRCPASLLDLFAKAKRPDLITVGVVQQNIRSDVDCFREYCHRAKAACRPDNVRMIRMPADESRGVMVVRHMASSMYEGEKYFLQLDAHNKFAQDWDEHLIRDLKRIPNERTVLSHHPPAVESLAGWGHQAINICKYEWDGNGLPRFASNVISPPSNKPFPGVFIGSGMVFARAEILIDCPFDKHLPFLFSGEELLLAACAFSHGWDIYNPIATPVFHFYKGGPKGDKSINPVNDRIHAKSMKRLKFALGVKGSFDSLPQGEWRKDFELYGMGSARRLDHYYKYAGINWEKKSKNWPFCSMHDDSYYKYHNEPVVGIPALADLSFAKGVSPRELVYSVETGDKLVRSL